MTKREMISLLIKLVGVWALVLLVPSLAQGIVLFGTGAYQLAEPRGIGILLVLLGLFVSPLVWIFLCVLVILKSDWFAARLYPEDGPAGQLTTLGVEEFRHLGYHFIGLLLIVKSLVPLLRLLYLWVLTHRLAYENYPSPLSQVNSQWVIFVFQLAIGLYLFLRPRGLATLWRRVQGKADNAA